MLSSNVRLPREPPIGWLCARLGAIGWPAVRLGLNGRHIVRLALIGWLLLVVGVGVVMNGTNTHSDTSTVLM